MTADDNKTITRRFESRPEDADVIEVPRLIVAFECGRPLVAGLRLSLSDVDEVIIGRGPERTWSRANRQLLLMVPDPEMSRMHVRMTRQQGAWNLDDVGSKNGTQVDGVRVSRSTLGDGNLIELGRTLFVYRDHAEQQHDPGDRDLAEEESVPEVFRTLSLSLERRAIDLVRIAPTPVPVLIVGPTGTGKELVARAIHSLSARRGPFVPVNCGALPRTLIESELFGARAGAFTNSRESLGLARRADGGTLFLDEVAELPEESQVALLRLLQEGEVRPVGSADFTKVNVRVVAATHQDLQARISEGRFRRDLYARLAGYEVKMPSLSDRTEDIGSLIATLLRRIGGVEQSPGFTVSPQAAFALFEYSYPMNVRELEQALRAAVALAEKGDLTLEHFPPSIRSQANIARRQLDPDDVVLRAQLVDLLRYNQGNVTATARALSKAPVQVRRWCRRLGIDLNEFRRQ